MENQEPIINKVSQSGLLTLDLKEIYPDAEKVTVDMKDYLFQGMILREKEFREKLKNEDWEKYKAKYVLLTCSADAIIPSWAYMLLVTKLEPFAKVITFGSEEDLDKEIFRQVFSQIHLEEFKGAKVVVKGCSDIPVKEFAYVEITRLLRPYVASLMFGEPCSTVPIYKQKKKLK